MKKNAVLLNVLYNTKVANTKNSCSVVEKSSWRFFYLTGVDNKTKTTLVPHWYLKVLSLQACVVSFIIIWVLWDFYPIFFYSCIIWYNVAFFFILLFNGVSFSNQNYERDLILGKWLIKLEVLKNLGTLADVLFIFFIGYLWALGLNWIFFLPLFIVFVFLTAFVTNTKKIELINFIFLFGFFWVLKKILFLFVLFLGGIGFIVEVLFTIVLILIPIAAYSLVDRKIMASVQRRKGPNVLGFFGFLQFLVDGFKLFAKEIIIPTRANTTFFFLSPLLAVSLSLLGWAIVPMHPIFRFPEMSMDLIVLLTLSSLNVYTVVLSGWASNSRYAFLGSIRAIAQIISYEIPMFFSLLPIIAWTGSLSISNIVNCQHSISFFIPFFPSAVAFFICIVAETNRAPFDLAEAESELVAGFNTEYSSLIFAFFFISEYSNMLLMSVLWINLFWAGWLPFFFFKGFENFAFFCFGVKLGIVTFIFSFVRANLPRYRYDQFMDFGWKVLMPWLFLWVCISLILILNF